MTNRLDIPIPYTPLNIYNGTPSGVLLDISRETLPINQVKRTNFVEVCSNSNVHRCKTTEMDGMIDTISGYDGHYNETADQNKTVSEIHKIQKFFRLSALLDQLLDTKVSIDQRAEIAQKEVLEQDRGPMVFNIRSGGLFDVFFE